MLSQSHIAKFASVQSAFAIEIIWLDFLVDGHLRYHYIES